MLKTPEEILEKINKHFEETKIGWEKHLSPDGEKDYLLTLREEENPQVAEEIKEVFKLMNDALKEVKKDGIESWKKFYAKWNGDPDYMNEDKHDEDKDLVGQLSDLRDFLVEWERSSYEQSQQELIKKLQNLLQTAGINPNDENAEEQVEGIKQIQDDLTDLGIDKSKVKETIENERKESEQSQQGLKDLAKELNLEVGGKTPAQIKEAIIKEIEKISQINELIANYFGKNMWEKVKIEAQIEVKEK